MLVERVWRDGWWECVLWCLSERKSKYVDWWLSLSLLIDSRLCLLFRLKFYTQNSHAEMILLEWFESILIQFYINLDAILWKSNQSGSFHDDYFRVVHFLTNPFVYHLRFTKWTKIEVPQGTSILVQFVKLNQIKIESLDYYKPPKWTKIEPKSNQTTLKESSQFTKCFLFSPFF